MGAVNDDRIQILESQLTFVSKRLSGVLREIDARLDCSNVWTTITRSGGLISKVEYFSNSAKTIKVLEQNFTRSAGVGGTLMITEIESIYYNEDTSEDSRVVTTVNRPTLGSDDDISGCDSPFSTTEPSDC